MKYVIVSSSELAHGHTWAPEFWIMQKLEQEWDARSAEDRAATVKHYDASMTKARTLRNEAQALLDHARMIEAQVAPLETFVKRERKK